MLINAYGFEKMCRAGIPVLDVFPMTSAYVQNMADQVHPNEDVYLLQEHKIEMKLVTDWENSDIDMCIYVYTPATQGGSPSQNVMMRL